MEEITKISQQTIKRYSDRYKKLGHDVKTLGWGTTQQQVYRFEQTLDCNIDFTNTSILDIGCGFGDYYKFLVEKDIKVSKYIGYDINEDLISEAKNSSSSLASFDVVDILNNNLTNIADIGVMLGLLNFNLKDSEKNLEYSKIFIEKAFAMVNDLLIVDFLSTNLTSDYEKEDFVFYHNPAEMLEFAFSLSSNVVLKHNYLPIPQKEFMLFIYKD